MPPPAVPTYRTTVGALAFGQLMCWAALYYAFSTFVLPMQAELRFGTPALMGAFSCGLVAWGACSYLAGAAIDRGHGRLVLTLGAALGGVGFLLWSQAQSLYALYAVWVLMGAAMAMTLYEPAFNVLTKRYPDGYRRGITVVTLAGGFASTLAFPAAAALVATIGWRDALVAIGVVLLLIVAPVHAWALPAASGTRQEEGAAAAEPSPAPTAVVSESTIRDALRQRSFWLLTLTFTLYAFVVAAVWAHIVPMFAALGRTPSQAVAVIVWIGPAQVLGRVVHLALAQAMSARTLGLMVLGAMPIGLLLLALGHSVAAMYLFALLFGFGNGVVTIVRGLLVPEYFGRGHVGRIAGAMVAFTLFARATAPLGAAWLLLALRGYRELLLLLAGIGAAALVTFVIARPAR
jgi:MFS family permease